MTLTFAARGQTAIQDFHGEAQPAASVLIKAPDGSNAVLYTDRIRSATTPNPTTTDAFGQLVFFSDQLGVYTLFVTTGAGVSVRQVEVRADAADDVSAPDVASLRSSVTTADGIVTGGATSNAASIEDAIGRLGSVGGRVLLPPGLIGVDTDLIVPANVELVAQGMNQPSSHNGLLGTTMATTLVPTSAFSGQSVLKLAGIGAQARMVNVDAHSIAEYAVMIDAPDCTLDRVSWQGGLIAGLEATANADRVNWLGCYGNQETANDLFNFELLGVDNIIVGCRFKGGVKHLFSSGNVIIFGGHWTGGNDNVLVDGTGKIHFVGTIFDSAVGDPAVNALIRHNGSNRVDLQGCEYFSAGTGGMPVFKRTSTGHFSVNGGLVFGTNSFGHLGVGMGDDDMITGLTVYNVTTLWDNTGPRWYELLQDGLTRHTPVTDSGMQVPVLTPAVGLNGSPGASSSCGLTTNSVAHRFAFGTGGFGITGGISGENITVIVTFTWSDNSTSTLSTTVPGNTATTSFANRAVAQAQKQGLFISAAGVTAQTSAGSTLAVVTVNLSFVPVT